ncbi:MAG TPA: zinc ribbon domain-containing protein [Candidatus Aenigmarchaeota archaeon]|nr:zinc ribbon domain-containing protein [Candidatus Aenigmarchaeota archaeon]
MFFERKTCPRCGRKVKSDFKFCPYCGEDLSRGYHKSLFEEVERDFEEIDKLFDISKFGFPVRSGGVSITIHSGEGEPRIEVKTFGDYKRFEPHIKKKLGIKDHGIKEIERKVKKPKVTEEPKTEIKKVDGGELITVNLPGVKSIDDVEIRKLEQSIEIKAFCNGKVYFTLIPIKPNSKIVERRFEKGILTLQLRG